jgi:hypothetical protein
MKETEMIFGTRAVIEAVQAGKEVDKILMRRDLQNDLSRELFNVVKTTRIPIQRVPQEKLDRLTRKNQQGVIAFISAVTYQTLEDIVPFLYEEGKNPFILDSKEPTKPFADFIESEVRYNSLKLQFPKEAEELFIKTAEDAKERLHSYKRLAEHYDTKEKKEQTPPKNKGSILHGSHPSATSVIDCAAKERTEAKASGTKSAKNNTYKKQL